MLIVAHVVVGLLIGKLTGQWALAVLGATIMDLDHLVSYSQHGLLRRPGRLWKALIDPRDPYGDQRGVFHNVFLWAIATAFLYRTPWGVAFCAGWFSHLVLDAFDASDARLFWPLRWNVRGPIPYGSRAEWVFTIVMLATFFAL